MKENNQLTIIPYSANAGFGITFPSKSIIIKGENLIIISPGNFSPTELESFKEITETPIIIAPNNFHHLNIPKMFDYFPKGKFYGPKRAMKQSGVDLTPTMELLSNDQIIPFEIIGNKTIGETCFYHSKSKTLITTDLFMNMHHKMNFSTRSMLTIAGTYHKLNMSRLVKSSINNKQEFYNSIRSLLDFPFETVILGHGGNISRKEFEELTAAFPE